jgi:hypothetical protein
MSDTQKEINQMNTIRTQIKAIEAHAAERTNGDRAEQIAIISKAQFFAAVAGASETEQAVLAIAKRRIIRKENKMTTPQFTPYYWRCNCKEYNVADINDAAYEYCPLCQTFREDGGAVTAEEVTPEKYSPMQ